jgi:hypothetical protein
MRYRVHEFLDQPWSTGVIPLQGAFNNALPRLIGCSPNEMVTGIKANTSLSLLTLDNNRIPEAIQNLKRIDAEPAIEFAANAAKEYYDSRHIPIELESGLSSWKSSRMRKTGEHTPFPWGSRR